MPEHNADETRKEAQAAADEVRDAHRDKAAGDREEFARRGSAPRQSPRARSRNDKQDRKQDRKEDRTVPRPIRSTDDAPKEPPKEPKVLPPPDETDLPHQIMQRRHEEFMQRQYAAFKPVDGNWDDPEFLASQEDHMKKMAAWAAEEPVRNPLQVDAPKKDPTDNVRISAQTSAEQHPQWIGPVDPPGARRKIETVVTDPSQNQVAHPVGELAQTNANVLAEALAATPLVAKLLDRIDQLEKKLDKDKGVGASQQWEANTTRPSYQPAKYLKHYRNEVSPNKVYYRGTFNKDRDRFEYDREVHGEAIRFTNSHFYAEEPWQVEIMDWAMKHPSVHPVSGQVVGGDPAIWVDDDSADAIPCPECLGTENPKWYASPSKLAEHRRTAHGIGVEV